MSPELDEKLCCAYPEIFADRHGDMRTTAMVWGFEHDDGWYNILDALCKMITGPYYQARQDRERIGQYIAEKAANSGTLGESWADSFYTPERLEAARIKEQEELLRIPRARQVKEKFGTLRFYISGSNERIDSLIGMACILSGRTCEVCGDMGSLRGHGWYKTLCDEHADALGYDNEPQEEE